MAFLYLVSCIYLKSEVLALLPFTLCPLSHLGSVSRQLGGAEPPAGLDRDTQSWDTQSAEVPECCGVAFSIGLHHLGFSAVDLR